MRKSTRNEARARQKSFHRVMRIRFAVVRRLKPLLLHKYLRVLLDGSCGAIAVMLGYGLRFDMRLPIWARQQMTIWACILFFLVPLAISARRGYRSTWQHVGLRDLRTLTTRLAMLYVLVFVVASLPRGLHLMPYGIVVMDCLITVLLCGGVRIARRIDHESLLRVSADHRILIVGTEKTIAGALRQVLPLYGGGILGAVLEDDALKGRYILGVPVLGTISSLPQLLTSHRATLIFLSSADVQGLPALLQVAADLDVPLKMLPSIQDLLDDRVRVTKPVPVSALRRILVLGWAP